VRLVPLAWLVVAPAALVGASLVVMAEAGERASPAARVMTGALGAAFGLVVGFAVSGGRHFAALPLRAGFVLLVGTMGFVGGALLVPIVRCAGNHALARRRARSARSGSSSRTGGCSRASTRAFTSDSPL